MTNFMFYTHFNSDTTMPPMAALAFPIALGMSNIGFAPFSPIRTPPHHARVDLASPSGMANPETLVA
jgi:hypothetical protein